MKIELRMVDIPLHKERLGSYISINTESARQPAVNPEPGNPDSSLAFSPIRGMRTMAGAIAKRQKETLSKRQRRQTWLLQ